MVRLNFKLIVSSAFLVCLSCISGCDKQNIQEAGYLEGKISIGPLCPVETDPPEPGCLPTAETYKAYPVSVWTSNDRRKIAQINPALDGSYRIELSPGNYLIKLEREQYTIGRSNLPSEVSIITQKETILDIDIDTGIR
jgi:hypothetical protein